MLSTVSGAAWPSASFVFLCFRRLAESSLLILIRIERLVGPPSSPTTSGRVFEWRFDFLLSTSDSEVVAAIDSLEYDLCSFASWGLRLTDSFSESHDSPLEAADSPTIEVVDLFAFRLPKYRRIRFNGTIGEYLPFSS